MGLKIGRVPPADIVLSDPSVSRDHCIVGLANDELLVSDLNSTNGTFIDGVRIGRAAVLPVASVLRCGKVSMSHEIRTRAELESGIDPLTTKSEGDKRGARVAISS
jgi:pSer/pThr/pTyr-binding forkhead associated (FHA) protein